jgi:serine protease AprX
MCIPKKRAKATWGARAALSTGLLLVLALAVPAVAVAGDKGSNKGKGDGRPDTQVEQKTSRKLDAQLEKKSAESGESDVIVEFYNDGNSGEPLKNFGKVGRKLGLIQSYTLRIPNGLLKQLERHPNVKKISFDRPVTAFIGRTAVTVGARAVQDIMGYNGAGVGVAVIDSGINPWHDDFTVANRAGQRVAHFKDFTSTHTKPYDDWGHGTHVAGIVAGNGYDSKGTRGAIAPGAKIIALKALKGDGTGTISGIIAAIDYAVSLRATHNIRVINLSLGAGVYESYNTDPLTIACKRAVEAGIVVVAAAGNLGRAANGQPQYGAISSPANAPWVLTVGASSTEGSVDRRDDKIAPYSSRGPTRIDHAAKPDLVAPGSGTVSLADPKSRIYLEKAQFLVKGSLTAQTLNELLNIPVLSANFQPYVTLSGTSMAAPVVSGTVALMLQANPNLTPNLVKAILQYTAQVYSGYDWLTQGAGFLNSRGAVLLAEYFRAGGQGARYPKMRGWSQHIFWGNYRVRGGVLTRGGTAWGTNVVWGDLYTPTGQNVVWGENCDTHGTCEGDNIVWGNNVVWGNTFSDNVVWGNTDGDNVVWGNGSGLDILWANGDSDNVVWGNTDGDNVVWGNDCEGANCEAVVWGTADGDNVVWGNAEGIDNVVWGNGTDDTVWGTSGEAEVDLFADDVAEVDAADPTVWDLFFEMAAEEVSPAPPADLDPPPADTPPPPLASLQVFVIGVEGGLL